MSVYTHLDETHSAVTGDGQSVVVTATEIQLHAEISLSADSQSRDRRSGSFTSLNEGSSLGNRHLLAVNGERDIGASWASRGERSRYYIWISLCIT